MTYIHIQVLFLSIFLEPTFAKYVLKTFLISKLTNPVHFWRIRVRQVYVAT